MYMKHADMVQMFIYDYTSNTVDASRLGLLRLGSLEIASRGAPPEDLLFGETAASYEPETTTGSIAPV